MDLLHFSDAALAAISRMRKELNVPSDYSVRVGVRGAGCVGVSYLLGFDKYREGDRIIDVQGNRVYIDPRHGMHVLGMEIGYVDSEDQKGFVFITPEKKLE